MGTDTVTLKKNGDFRRLYARGKKYGYPALVIYVMKNRAGTCRIGITASKKIGNAVQRNRARRIIKEAYRNIKNEISPNYDIVFVARRKTVFLKTPDIEKVMRDALVSKK